MTRLRLEPDVLMSQQGQNAIRRLMAHDDILDFSRFIKSGQYLDGIRLDEPYFSPSQSVYQVLYQCKYSGHLLSVTCVDSPRDNIVDIVLIVKEKLPTSTSKSLASILDAPHKLISIVVGLIFLCTLVFGAFAQLSNAADNKTQDHSNSQSMKSLATITGGSDRLGAPMIVAEPRATIRAGGACDDDTGVWGNRRTGAGDIYTIGRMTATGGSDRLGAPMTVAEPSATIRAGGACGDDTGVWGNRRTGAGDIYTIGRMTATGGSDRLGAPMIVAEPSATIRAGGACGDDTGVWGNRRTGAGDIYTIGRMTATGGSDRTSQRAEHFKSCRGVNGLGIEMDLATGGYDA